MNEWRDIATAPLDGTPLLLFCPGIHDWQRKKGLPDIVVGIWEWDRYTNQSRGAWYSDVGEIDTGYESTGPWFEHERLHPTHWQPLPEPPEG